MREVFKYHPVLFGLMISLLLLLMIAAIISIFDPKVDERRDARARCESISGVFSTGNNKCYVGGDEV